MALPADSTVQNAQSWDVELSNYLADKKAT
ncbi:hypothetical protein OOU_Y34scaffold00744g61 [Pyricularia oryzae Y34]|uniref:Uncharacterized protein n=2 Tax=Pyricularia oryzae TaxID=318829 RepID=A0AA97PHM6_PYRO3|nr:hypothetical protein OOU_Y34scaffold00744g61 [Pyricularia oryzae Y34]